MPLDTPDLDPTSIKTEPIFDNQDRDPTRPFGDKAIRMDVSRHYCKFPLRRMEEMRFVDKPATMKDQVKQQGTEAGPHYYSQTHATPSTRSGELPIQP